MSIDTRCEPSVVPFLSKPSLTKIGLAILVSFAILLRLEPVLVEPSLVWPDEIFQTAEPAHRLVFGSGLIPWEFQLGARSWLLPGSIAALMEISRIAGDGPDYYLPLIAVAFAALAAAPMICCFLWCRRLLGVAPALLGGMAVAVAAEPVYFGARTLAEVVAGHVLVVAAYVLEPGYLVTSQRRRFAGGALLGLILVVRVQLAPALIIVGLWTNWRTGRERLVAVLAGAAVVLAAAGAIDTLTLGYPLASVWRYLVYNVYYGVSSTFGVEPWWYYLVGELGVWQGAGATMLLLAAVGGWRLPLLPVLVITIVGIHSGIAHKEYRFIYPAIMLVTVLGAVGLAQLAVWARDWLIDRGVQETVAALASMAFAIGWWGLASFQVWTGTTLSFYRLHLHDRLVAASYVAHGPAPCGIGLYGLAGKDWTDYGGYTYFHRPAPMYWPKDAPGLIAAAAGFDTLLYTKPPPPELGFTTSRCIGEVCIAQRAGGCQAQPTTPLPVPAALQGLASGAAPVANGIGRE